MIQLTLAFLFFFMGSSCGTGNPVTSYENQNGAWLGLHTEPAVFWDACDNCQREGSVLASSTTDAMVRAMLTLMAKHNLKSNSVFTGMASEPKVERFLCTFSNGSLKEAAGVPSDTTDELCLALTGVGALADVSCARALPYFCHKKSVNQCGDNGYEYEPRTGSYYKFHAAAQEWRPAQKTCHDEGGHLAVINHPTESTVLKEIHKKNSETLSEAGFNEWATGEPNNRGGNENCGSMAHYGLLNDVQCKNEKFAFICEITP